MTLRIRWVEATGEITGWTDVAQEFGELQPAEEGEIVENTPLEKPVGCYDYQHWKVVSVDPVVIEHSELFPEPVIISPPAETHIAEVISVGAETLVVAREFNNGSWTYEVYPVAGLSVVEGDNVVVEYLEGIITRPIATGKIPVFRPVAEPVSWREGGL